LCICSKCADQAGRDLTGRSPVGNADHSDLDAPTAKFLQETAWETVREYYGK
jgi:hypothetical protein